jgi:excisionase family DNA binding protein
MSPDDLQLLLISEVARLTRQHRSTIYRHEKQGRLRFVHVGSRSPRVTLEEFERYRAGLDSTLPPSPIHPLREARRDH